MFLVIIISAITLGLFFTSLLATKKSKEKTDYLLICWLLVLTFQLAAYYVEIGHFKYNYLFTEFSGAFVFLHGPILWLYMLGIHDKNTFSFWPKVLRHFVPFIINLLLIPFLVTHSNYPIAMTLFFFKITSITTYMLLSLKKLKHYSKIIENSYFQPYLNQTKWLKIVIFGILFTTVVGALTLISTELHLVNIALEGEFFIPIFLSSLIFILGFYGLRQTNIFLENAVTIDTNNTPLEQKLSTENKVADKYHKTGLNQADSELMFEQLQSYIKDKKPYLDPDLTLHKLADELAILPNQLSQVINQNAHQNFHSYINNLRIAVVIAQLKEDKHHTQTLLSIAYEAGFSSKTSFNRSFKKTTGFTPTAYLQREKR